MPRALPARSGAPGDAASPERWRSAGRPSTEVRTSTHTGSPDPAPPSVTPSAVEPPSRPTVTTSITRTLSHCGSHVGGAEPQEAPPGIVAPPGGTGAVEPRHGDHAPRTGRALPGQA